MYKDRNIHIHFDTFDKTLIWAQEVHKDISAKNSSLTRKLLSDTDLRGNWMLYAGISFLQGLLAKAINRSRLPIHTGGLESGDVVMWARLRLRCVVPHLLPY